MTYRPFSKTGKWFKGNLHCHTNFSDGRLTPEEVVELYRGMGYSFLAISDHERFADYSSTFDTDDFITIPGIERAVAYKGERNYHFLGLTGIPVSPPKTYASGHKTKVPEEKGIEGARKVIKELQDKGNWVVLNHPLWSRLTPDDFVDLDGFSAIEVYNRTCAVNYHDNGDGTVYWDILLRRGKKIWALANDDNHNRLISNNPDNTALNPEDPKWDSGGGWICVNAEKLSSESLMTAMKEGRFYASTGPEIFDYSLEDDIVQVRNSQAREIHFVTYEQRGKSLVGENLTEGRYKLKGNEIYVRVEIVDAQGRRAWTNPIFING